MALRAYAVPAGLLVGGAKANVLAVRTKTIGGAGQGAADGDGSFPGGLFGHTAVYVASRAAVRGGVALSRQT